jgi:hypothetical protein
VHIDVDVEAGVGVGVGSEVDPFAASADPWLINAGGVHEWFGVHPFSASHAPVDAEPRVRERAQPGAGQYAGGRAASPWRPPLCILAHLARTAVLAHGRHDDDDDLNHALVIWIGRACWPFAELLAPSAGVVTLETGRIGRAPDLRRRSIFIDPANGAERLWSIDLAVRTSSVAAVIADGRGFGLRETRRLQLAAEHAVAPILLARPAEEVSHLSAAGIRWMVSAAPSSGRQRRPRWRIELRRAKSRVEFRQHVDTHPSRLVEWNHATRTVAVPAAVVRRSRPTTHSSVVPILGRRSA